MILHAFTAPQRPPRGSAAPLPDQAGVCLRLLESFYLRPVYFPMPAGVTSSPEFMHPTRVPARSGLLTLLIAILAGCGEATGPEIRTRVEVYSGDAQFGTPGDPLENPLAVRVTGAASGQPVQGVRVTWRAIDGSAVATPIASVTDDRGIATTSVTVNALGEARIRAESENITGGAALFSAAAVIRPVISSVAPAVAHTGDTITITGTGFDPENTAVLFDGMSALIHSATAVSLRVIVPPCVGTRVTAVTVATGSVMSASVDMQTEASDQQPITLERGETRVLTDTPGFRCLRLPAQLGATWLLIAQNTGGETTAPMPFTLTALGVPPAIALSSGRTDDHNFASDWELALRRRERALDSIPGPALSSSRTTGPLPALGERRAFNTLTPDGRSTRITAEVVAVTTRAILYQDVAAPPVFDLADYQRFGKLFDDPIYSTETAVFGSIGDVDGNGRVIILFTPRVNALALAGLGSYIAGYFYSCDLLARSRCGASNGGEIFYSMVPDPEGLFGQVHTSENVFRTVPPVLAHELQHMISHRSRNGTSDQLWLAEGLAHTAEDLVGSVLTARGDPIAPDFFAANHANARRYVENIGNTAIVDDVSPGTVALRGAGWLLLRYLRSQYGGNALLTRLTATTEVGTDNVAAATGVPWSSLMSDFAVAVFADDAPDLAGVSIPARFTFPDINLRTVLSFGGFALDMDLVSFSDFALAGQLPPASQQYAYVQAPLLGSGGTLNIVYGGAHGGPFQNGAPRLIIMRVR